MKLIDNQTASVNVSFTEPVLDSNGNSLQDLAYSSIYYGMVGGPKVVGAKIPASSPIGGGPQETTLIVPAPTGHITELYFFATSTDLSGNEGPSTPTVAFVIERIAPAEPVNFIVA